MCLANWTYATGLLAVGVTQLEAEIAALRR